MEDPGDSGFWGVDRRPVAQQLLWLDELYIDHSTDSIQKLAILFAFRSLSKHSRMNDDDDDDDDDGLVQYQLFPRQQM